VRPLPDAALVAPEDDSRTVEPRYPIVWRESSGPTFAGSLRLAPSALVLDGTAGDRRRKLEIPYEGLVSLRVASTGPERLGRRPTLLLDEHSGRRLRIAAVGATGIVGEVADALARALTVA
jgi:hypothetical protein